MLLQISIWHSEYRRAAFLRYLCCAVFFFPSVDEISWTSDNYLSLMYYILDYQLQAEAALTLDCIQKCEDKGFEEVFLTKCDFAAKYDYCVR